MTMSKDDDICWYHPNLSRETAEKKLLEESKLDGSYLVRESSSAAGDYVLSVLHDNQVSHFQIRRHADDAFFSIDESVKIHGLESLIEYYVEKPSLLAADLTLTNYVKGEAPPHDSRRHGRTNLLHRATSQGSYTVVSELLRTGYRHEAKNKEGQTAVHLASMDGKDDILRKLIEYGANVNTRDTAGYTPLHYACQYNFPSTVRLLVQVGEANVQARNTDNGSVPLHEAAARGHTEVVKELLSLNAPANPRNKNNLLPSQLARANNHVDCAEVLENYKSPPPKTNRNLWYHGTLNRSEAESKIRKYSDSNGTFLVRWSDRNKAIVLTLYNDKGFFNYIIKNQGNYLFIDDGPYLDSLEHIIEYYSFIADGLPTILRTPVPPEPKPPLPEFSTMPRPGKKNLLKIVQSIPNQDDESDKSQKSVPSQFQNISFTTNFAPPSNNNNNYSTDEDNDDYIPVSRLKWGNAIGEGEFGSVLDGVYTMSNGETVKVAIKTLHEEHLNGNKGRENFLREAQVMMGLDHHCIVKLIGLVSGPPLRMIQELVPLGSMLTYVIQNKTRINPDYEFKIWAAQIACGMNYLEEHRFVHRDLAARNILLASQIQAKISDFGLSRAINRDEDCYVSAGGGKWPLKWYAPEAFNGGTFSHQSDVWSFGVTIWEMYSFGAIPYGERRGTEAISAINKGERLAQPEICPDYVYDIMLKCWDFNPNNRPTFRELLEIFTADADYVNIKELVVERNLS